ncbi:MAG: tetratricopeptide repeat protein [Candidatus Methanoperedens sp.]|nr:tetratricopeptide repeat protein [Candidatus Methanoperedens sp.]
MSLFSGLKTSKRNQMDGWIEKGILSYNAERFEEAIKYYDKVLEVEPSWIALNNKGNALRSLRRFGEALHCFEEAIGLNAEDWHPLHGMANVLADLGRTEEALLLYDKVLKSHPEDLIKASVLAEKGGLLSIIDRKREADECFKLALALDPQNYVVLSNIALSCVYSGNKDKIIEYIERTMEVIPESERPKKIKVILDLIDNIIEKESTKHERSIKEKENLSARALNFEGETLLNSGKINNALKCFEEALKINPKLSEAWEKKGKILCDMGRSEEALTSLDMALKLESQNPATWHNKGAALLSLNRYEESIQCYERTIQIDPNNSYAWLSKGICLYELLKFDEAMQCVDRVLEIDPSIKYAREFREKISKEISRLSII